MRGFRPETPGEPGIEMATFNMREGRVRQSNLHLVKPGRLRNRQLIEEMYEHRHQREVGLIVDFAWRLLWDRPEDAASFEKHFPVEGTAQLARDGSVVDVVDGSTDALREVLDRSRKL